MNEVTPWFDGELKPVRVGLYERCTDSGFVLYSWWNGEDWYAGPALKRSLWQNIRWRGLTQQSYLTQTAF